MAYLDSATKRALNLSQGAEILCVQFVAGSELLGFIQTASDFALAKRSPGLILSDELELAGRVRSQHRGPAGSHQQLRGVPVALPRLPAQ